ncbi:MAG: hydroxyacid dehydrogenase [Calditrichia bacterium]
MKILISDKSSAICGEILEQGGHSVDVRTGLSPEELKSIIGDYHGLVVRSATTVTADLLEAANNLRVIGRAGTGVDNIDLEAARSRDILVMNTPGGNSNAVAEIVLAQMLGLTRSLYQACSSLKSERWEKKSFSGGEIMGKTVGILGYGRVSRLLAKKCMALGMVVLCNDPKISKDILDSDGISIRGNLDDVLGQSDFLSVHLSKRDNTLNFLADAEFAKIKKGCFLLNYARGGIVNESALISALDNNTLAGAALDVFSTEPPVDFTLIQHEKVIATPHIGAASKESQENVAAMVAEQFVEFFAGKQARNVVNK